METNEKASIKNDNFELKHYFGTQTKKDCNFAHVCVESKNEGDSICAGDFGGPLMHTKNGKTSVVGVGTSTAFKYEDGKKIFCNDDAIYIRLEIFKDFIKKNVGNFCTA